MFREMRRSNCQIPKEETERILKEATNGVLGVIGDEGYPYTVPVSFVYDKDKIFFHCATTGHKLDGIKKNPKVSFCVVGRDEILPEKFDTNFESAIAFGLAKIVEADQVRQHALELILDKYSKDFKKEGLEYIKKAWEEVTIVEIEIQHLTGKTAD